MDSLPYDNLEQLALVLKATYMGTDEERKIATEVLTTMGKDPIRFIDAMVNFINAELPSNDQVMLLKRTAVILIPSVLSLCEKLDENQRRHIVLVTLDVLVNENLPFKLKQHLDKILLIFYSTDRGKLRSEGLGLAKDLLQTDKVTDIYAALLILNCSIKASKLYQQTASPWFIAFTEGLVKSGDKLITGLVEEIEMTIQNPKETNRISNIAMGLMILKLWMDVICQFTKYLGKKESCARYEPKYLELLTNQEHLIQIVIRVLRLYFPTEKQITGCLFSTSGIEKVDETINAMKHGVFECFNTILAYTQTYSKESKTSLFNTKFYDFMKQRGVLLAMDSISRFCKSDSIDLEKSLDNEQLSNCVVSCIDFLTKLTFQKELFHLFSNNRNNLVMNICFMLVKATSQEIIDFSENPSEFVNLAIDTIEKQDSGLPKTQAMQFLEHMCGQIDGVLSYTVVMLLQIIDYSLVGGEITAIPEKFPRLVDYQESAFLTQTNPLIRLETCLLTLSSISYLVSRRDDLKPILERVFKEYQHYFLNDETPPLIKSRICLFLGSYLHHLFKEKEDLQIYQLYITFLVKCAGYADQELQAVAEQASHALCRVFDSSKEPNTRLKPYINDILNHLAAYIKFIKGTQFFELLNEIVKSYEYEIVEGNQDIVQLLHFLVERADVEYRIIKADESANKHTFDKVWHVILNIIQIKDVILRYQTEVEQCIQTLFTHLETDSESHFEDDILHYMALVIKTRREVTPLFWTFFNLFPKIFEKNQGMLWHLFSPLNQLIIHGKQAFDQNQNMTEVLLEMLIKGLNPTSPKSNSANVSEAAVLLQLSIQYLTISEFSLNAILKNCLLKLQEIDKSYLKARLGGVFLCAFLVNFKLTQVILVDLGASTYLMDFFIKDVLLFESHPYDRKVYLMGMTHILAQTDVHPTIVEKLPQILGILIVVFKYVETIEKVTAEELEANPGAAQVSNKFSRSSDVGVLKRMLVQDGVVTDIVNNYSGIENGYPRNLFEDNGLNILNLDGEEHKNQGNDSNTEDTDDEDDSDLPTNFRIVLTSKDEANKVLDKFDTDFKKQDEFAYFKTALRELRDRNPKALDELLNSLPEFKKNSLKDILFSQRVVVDEAEGKSQARRIVKPRARKVAQNATYDPQE